MPLCLDELVYAFFCGNVIQCIFLFSFQYFLKNYRWDDHLNEEHVGVNPFIPVIPGYLSYYSASYE